MAMNLRIGSPSLSAFTRSELILVLGFIALLFCFIFSGVPGIRAKEKAKLVSCMASQRQIVLGLAMFASTNGDQFPALVSITNGGAMEPMSDGNVMSCFATLTNSINPYAFVCPSDKLRARPERGQPLTRTNLSYFISLDATSKDPPVTTILTGDRHLELNGKSATSGVFGLSMNCKSAWTTELHFMKGQGTRGVVSFVDGHVEATKNLAGVVARQNMASNRVVVP